MPAVTIQRWQDRGIDTSAKAQQLLALETAVAIPLPHHHVNATAIYDGIDYWGYRRLKTVASVPWHLHQYYTLCP